MHLLISDLNYYVHIMHKLCSRWQFDDLFVLDGDTYLIGVRMKYTNLSKKR